MKVNISEKLKIIRNETDITKKFELAKELHTNYEKQLKKNDIDIVRIEQAVKDGYIEFYEVGGKVYCEDYMGETVKLT